ncbi:MAG: ABC transporter ATP-binding protein/permease, partial [Oscillospiraceae bacterium]|nr:ABC transporter ATP-binding protein/permease [Oscillospiraceae bacterium]
LFGNLASQNFGNRLRKEMFSRIVNLSFQQTDAFTTGSLVNRLSNDVSRVQDAVKISFRGVVRYAMMFIGGVYMLYWQSPSFALIALCGLPFLLFFVIFFLRRGTPLFGQVQRRLDGISSLMQEDVAGARVIKASVREEAEGERFDRASDGLCRTNLRVQYLLSYLSPCMNIVLNLCVLAVIYVGGLEARAGAVTPGKIMAAISYLALILTGISVLGNLSQTLTRAGASWRRIREVLDSEPILRDGTAVPGPARGEVEFRHVRFTYPGSAGEALSDVSFHLKPGETLGVIGATGSGKSTLVNLIPRFYDATGGQVFLDGMDVRDYPLDELRKRISIVLQDARLFSRSIEANIRWGRAGATPWDIKAAAEIAQADEFICRSSEGYYTPVTEAGHSLSGGQKQRVALSRALVRRARLLILDDATSALDLKTEAAFYKALNREFPDLTKIIVAQRVASLQSADRILVLQDGRVAALGSQVQLLETSPVYREIYESQLKGGAGLAV